LHIKQEPVLQDINLKVKKGQTIALVGKSGSGKTTLVNLLPRFWDIEKGEILIDGVNIKDIKLENLRSLMGYVSQDPVLFNDSFEKNMHLVLTTIPLNKLLTQQKWLMHTILLLSQNLDTIPILATEEIRFREVNDNAYRLPVP
jgi:ABC-type multidrug transport system fused ATPase/permease subunit